MMYNDIFGLIHYKSRACYFKFLIFATVSENLGVIPIFICYIVLSYRATVWVVVGVSRLNVFYIRLFIG